MHAISSASPCHIALYENGVCLRYDVVAWTLVEGIPCPWVIRDGDITNVGVLFNQNLAPALVAGPAADFA